MSCYEIATQAEEDLRAIVAYTAQQWGVPQVRRYMEGLERVMEQLANEEVPYKRLDSLIEGLRMTRYQHHYVFGLIRPQKPILILALFHERMDLMTRLRDRLVI